MSLPCKQCLKLPICKSLANNDPDIISIVNILISRCEDFNNTFKLDEVGDIINRREININNTKQFYDIINYMTGKSNE